MKLPKSKIEQREYQSSRRVQDQVGFAVFCFEHELHPGDLAELMTLLAKCVSAGVADANKSGNRPRYERMLAKWEALATLLGFADIQWPGLYPTARKGGRRVDLWPTSR
jgi:hypothetical protein